MAVHVRRFDQARLMGWANGGGATREILRSPSLGPTYDWRISVADVEVDGPFSALEGIDRTIVFCEGHRMVLNVDGRIFDLGLGVPFRFSGDADTRCAIPEGPTRDLNVMTDRRTTVVETQMLKMAGQRVLSNTPQTELVVVALAVGISILGGSEKPTQKLAMYDTVHASGEERLRLRGDGLLLSARFRRRPW